MAKGLTTKSIENLKAGAARREVPDGGCAGLYLVVQPTGVRSWATRYRLNGKPAKLTLGRFPTVSLAEARRRATAALRQVAEGIDPAVEKRKTAIEVTDRKRDTVQAWSSGTLGMPKSARANRPGRPSGEFSDGRSCRYGAARASTISSAAT